MTRRLIEQFVARPLTGDTPGRLTALTTREIEVLRHIARGNSNADIAARLYLSEATVKTHVSRILTKLGLRDRAQAVVVAYETGSSNPATDPVASRGQAQPINVGLIGAVEVRSSQSLSHASFPNRQHVHRPMELAATTDAALGTRLETFRRGQEWMSRVGGR